VFEHPDEFNIDLDRVMLMGFSAGLKQINCFDIRFIIIYCKSKNKTGGNAAVVMSQRLIRRKIKKPLMQVLINPWLQLVSNRTIGYHFMSLQYIGFKDFSQIMPIYNTNEHVLLLDQATRKKYESYLNIDLIPIKHRPKDPKWKKVDFLKTDSRTLSQSSILFQNQSVAQRVLKLFDDEASPSFIDDLILKEFPTTYMIICDQDPLQDEQFVFSERLRRLGVEVEQQIYSYTHLGLMSIFSDHIAFNQLMSFVKRKMKKLTKY
jgi:acetyl esterase/lipase